MNFEIFDFPLTLIAVFKIYLIDRLFTIFFIDKIVYYKINSLYLYLKNSRYLTSFIPNVCCYLIFFLVPLTV